MKAEQIKLEGIEEVGSALSYRRNLIKDIQNVIADAVKEYLVPITSLPDGRTSFKYVNETEMLNMTVFGFSSKIWKKRNPLLAAQGRTIRTSATTEQLELLCLLALEDVRLIKEGHPMEVRKRILQEKAKELTGFD